MQFTFQQVLNTNDKTIIDTCTILKSGIIPDNSIRFTGDMSDKRIGASLPADY